MNVTPVISLKHVRPNGIGPLLKTTLQFEAIVDALVLYHQGLGILETPASAEQRDGYRQAALAMVNELDPATRLSAENDALYRVRDSFGVSMSEANALVTDVLDIVRTRLRQTPALGVGEIR